MQRRHIITLLVIASLAGAAVWWIRVRNPGSSQAVSTVAKAARLPATVDKITASRSEPAPRASVAAPAPVEPPAPLPANLQFILAPAPHTGYRARIAAVRVLGRNLSAAEINALADYLRAPCEANGPGWQAESEYWLRNDIMNKLVEQNTIPTGLADLLVGIYQDHNQNVVMRDYAVQHLPNAYAEMTSADQTSVRQALWQATGETDSSIAGTALLALLAMTGGTGSTSTTTVGAPVPADSTDRAQLTQTVLRLTGDEHCGELSRIAAISMCGRLGVQDALPVVTQLAQNAPSVPLRIVAIAALGDLGGQPAVTILEQLSQSPETRLRPAVASALQRLKQRMGI